MEFNELLKKRRSIYALSDKVEVKDQIIIDALANAINNAPTAFDSGATHIIVALGEKHHFVWDLTEKTLKKIVPENKFASTKVKLETFRKGYGTILVFKDLEKIDELKKAYPGFANRQDDWGEQNIGILVYSLWLSLYNVGLGGSIQHYDPLIDEGIKKEFKVPEGWKLETEMVFGNVLLDPPAKEYDPLESRLIVSK